MFLHVGYGIWIALAAGAFGALIEYVFRKYS